MVRTGPFLPLRLAAACTAAVLVAASLVAVFLPPMAEAELSLGPSHRHTPSIADFIARLSKGALDAAAGSANDLGFSRETVLIPTEAELAFFAMVNVDRAANGLSPLEFDPSLLGIARIRAAAQGGGPLSHVDALGQLAFVSLLSSWEVPYTLAGENLARHSRRSPAVIEALERALMNSPSHRANILEPTFQGIAIGEAGEGDGVAFAQIFRAIGS
jgi:uncharacterized protein YkwD